MTNKQLCCRSQNTATCVHHAMTCDEIIRLAKNIITTRFHRLETLSSPKEAVTFLQMQIGLLEHEVFCCIFLDQRHRVITFEKLFIGTISGATVHLREVAKRALQLNTAAVIFAHNHPSGVAEASASDKAITQKLVDTLSLFDIKVLDHLIVSGTEHSSFADAGLL